tara:strand:+ start:83 stop:643 length:561 start_codon:yes stop_codon:yes gene_type:complete
MRVVGGYIKGKKLNFIKSKNTRPLKDLVKESIFNIITHSKLINIYIQNSEVLDLYSGIGSFGIECISRGVKNVDFVEENNQAISILKENLNKLKLNEKSKLYETRIDNFINKFAKKKYDLFFFDPPFKENTYVRELESIYKLKLFKKNHLIIIHREKKSYDKFNNFFKILLEKSYGRSKILFATFI